jgi:2-dehydropantoate 2-reductase
MAKLMTFGPELGTSMYFDRLAGRPLEVEALTGAIVAAGQRLGVPTPLNGALLTLLRAVSDAQMVPTPSSYACEPVEITTPTER